MRFRLSIPKDNLGIVNIETNKTENDDPSPFEVPQELEIPNDQDVLFKDMGQ